VNRSRSWVSGIWRRWVAASMVVALAVLLGGGAALADPGDLVFRRMSGLGDSDRWLGVAAYDSSVYVVGERGHLGVIRRYSRTGDLIWTRYVHPNLGGYASIAGVSADGSGVYVDGYRWIDNQLQGFVAHYLPNATLDWLEPTFDGLKSYAVAIDTYGSYVYVTGMYGPNPGDDAVSTFVRKYTRDGVNVWTRHIDPDVEAYVVQVEPIGVAASADAVYLVGKAMVNDTSEVVTYLRTYDQEGGHHRTSTRAIGDWAVAMGVSADSHGAYVVARAKAIGKDDLEPLGSYLLFFDSSASFQWQRRITARSSTVARAVSAANNGVWITGTAFDRLTNQPDTSRDPDGDAFLVRYSHTGQPRLTYQYSRPGAQSGNAVFADYAGIYIAGEAARFGDKKASDVSDGLLLSAELP
jgi:hypothetical protein